MDRKAKLREIAAAHSCPSSGPRWKASDNMQYVNCEGLRPMKHDFTA